MQLFQKKNPAKCLECHGEKPKPIWDSYPFYPGVSGAEEDENSPLEQKYLKTFKKQKKDHSRYKHVPAPEKLYAIGLDNFSGNGLDGDDLAINLEFNKVLGRQNMQIIAQELKSNRTGQLLRYALLGAMTCTDRKIEEFIPKELKSYMKLNREVIKGKIEKSKTDYNLNRKNRHKSITKNDVMNEPNFKKAMDNVSVDDSLLNLQWILENFGYSTKSWPMTFEKGTFAFEDSAGGIRRLEFYLWKELLDEKLDKEEYDIYRKALEYINNNPQKRINSLTFEEPKSDEGSIRETLCSNLKDKSLKLLKDNNAELKAIIETDSLCNDKSLNDNSSIKLLSDKINDLTPLGTCFTCHSDFKNDDDLKHYFKKRYPRGNFFQEIEYRLNAQGADKMPKNKEISENEKKEILDYLKRFSEQN